MKQKTDNESKPLGIGWLKFYVKWRFPLGFIFGGLSILSGIAEGTQYGLFSTPLFIGLLATDILIYVFRIYVYSEMRNMTKSGYTANMALLVMETVVLVLNSSSRNGNSWMSIVMMPFGFLIWWLPNYIYFRHRKHLFTGILSIDEIAADYISENNTGCNRSAEAGQVKDDGLHFYCMDCGGKNTGWYQTCPNCGAVGKMKKISPTKEPQQSRTEPNKQDSISIPGKGTILFCRNCGTRLNPDAIFCSECGTPIVTAALQDDDISTQEGVFPQIADQVSIPSPTIQNQSITIDLHSKSLSPTLRRAFVFAEDGEWEKADAYLEKVLDGEPENAYAYLGKLLVEFKAESPEQLKNNLDEAKHSKNLYTCTTVFRI